jgi:hypothetical protein
VAGGAGSATDTAGTAVATVKDHMPTTGDARQGARRAVGVAKANPMALAIGALVLGAAAGLAIPSTRVEDERIGPVADDLREQGAEKAAEAVQQGREAISEKASEVAERGQDAVQQVSEEARERVSDVADRAASAGSGSSDAGGTSGGAEAFRPAGEPVRPVS